MTPAGLFTGVDRALVLAALAARLRAAGVVVPVGATERAAAALSVVSASRPGSWQGGLGIDDLYWLTRLSFVTERSQLDTFDKVFDAVFRSHDPRNEQRRDSGHGARSDTAPSPDRHYHRLRQAANGDSPSDGAGLPWTSLERMERRGRDHARLPYAAS